MLASKPMHKGIYTIAMQYYLKTYKINYEPSYCGRNLRNTLAWCEWL